MQTQTTLREIHAAHLAVRARINAPREIVEKPKPRPFQPTIGARYALLGRPLPTLMALTPTARPCSFGPAANHHVRAYRLNQAGVIAEADQQVYPKVAEIVSAVSAVSGVSMIDLKSNRRAGRMIIPRHVAMYLCRMMTLASMPEIGRRIGGRDHTSVLFACRKIEAIKDREDVAALIAAAKAELGASS